MPNRPDAVAAVLATFGDPVRLPATPVAVVLAAERFASLEAAGVAALPGLRAILDGPPLPVVELEPPETGAVGAKLLALAALEACAEDEDVARYERLAESPYEPLCVRLAAARCWFDSDPADTTPELVDLLVRAFPVEPETAARIVAPFWDVLETIVPPLVGHLYHRLRDHRLRARRLLVAVGQPARERLLQVFETTEDEFARADAAAALREIEGAGSPAAEASSPSWRALQDAAAGG